MSKKVQRKQFAVTELDNVGVNNFGAKKSAHCSWVLVLTEQVFLSGIPVQLLHQRKFAWLTCVNTCSTFEIIVSTSAIAP